MLTFEDEEEPSKPSGIVGANTGSRDEWGLLWRQRSFADEWLAGGNLTQAAICAGYKPKNADTVATVLMKHAGIRRYIAHRQSVLRRDREDRQRRLLDELEIMAHSDIEVYRRGPMKTLSVKPGADPVATRAVSKLKIKTKRYTDEKGREVVEDEMDIGLHSKTSAVDVYMKHLGMFPSTGSRLEIEDAEGNTLVIEEVME